MEEPFNDIRAVLASGFKSLKMPAIYTGGATAAGMATVILYILF
jgi:hypothetical protein